MKPIFEGFSTVSTLDFWLHISVTITDDDTDDDTDIDTVPGEDDDGVGCETLAQLS